LTGINSKRKGLSSVVAAVFMFIIVSGALTVTIWSTKQQDAVVNELLAKTQAKLGDLNEEIDISEVSIDNDKLNVTLTNNGGAATRATSIYIVNETASPKEQYRYDIDHLVDGRATVTNVGQTLPLVASDTTSYSVKVVTESGSSASADFLPLSLTPLPMSLYVIPPTVTTGENVTILYSITNNITNSNSPLTLSPEISGSISCQVSQACSLTKMTSAPSSIVIYKGSTTLIKEVYRVDGPPDTILTFNASYTGAVAGNYVIEKGSIIVVDLAQSVITSIATAPDMYLILPSPAGNSLDHALWGAVVVNPTNSTMQVSRVLITMFTGSHTGATKIVAAGCADTPIVPSTASEWTCPHDNQIMWRDLSTPETLQPGQTKTFLVRVQPTSLPAGEEEPGATVAATVYTDVGIFTKTGYTVGMTDIAQPLGNVYLTNTVDTSSSGALNNNNMLGHINNISPSTNTTFYVAMADLDTNSTSVITAGAKLIINVPPGFGNVTVISQSGFVSNATVTVRADGITQIVGTTNEDIGNSAAGEAKVIAFWAITPSPPTDTTYLMFTYVNGITNNNPPFSAGAIAETALQVNGTT
jgi:hypothetical protein